MFALMNNAKPPREMPTPSEASAPLTLRTEDATDAIDVFAVAAALLNAALKLAAFAVMTIDAVLSPMLFLRSLMVANNN
jgi:hypothetical protein